MDVSIIIVNYNTKDLIFDCLESIYSQTNGIAFEVIVSDNASTDDSVNTIKKYFPDVIIIENEKNIGFGSANNRALKIAKGKYIFYLNSDTILRNNAVKFFFDYYEKHKQLNIGGLGCNLQDKNGNYTYSFGKPTGEFSNANELLKNLFNLLISCFKVCIRHYLFRKPLRVVEKRKNNTTYTIGKVGSVIGADLFLKNNNFARFDENYFMYYEETDLELQMTRKGFEFYLIEAPEIIHLEGGSDKKVTYEVLDLATPGKLNLFYSRLYFYKKNKLASAFQLCLMKILTLLIWLNPSIIKETKKFREKLFLS